MTMQNTIETGFWILALALSLIGLGYFICDDKLMAGAFWVSSSFIGLLALLPADTKGE